MIEISYSTMVLAISILWLLVRFAVFRKKGNVSWKRELELLLVYICIIVVVRFTFCPFSKVNGQIQPLLFDPKQVWPFRINLLPIVYMGDYPTRGEILLNFIGNTAMFLPIGIIFPLVYKQLDTPGKAIAAGAGLSLCIEILQLPFFDRVSDIDDLLLNTLGYAAGYVIYAAIKALRKRRKKR